jgi:cobalt/nickel transport protein
MFPSRLPLAVLLTTALAAPASAHFLTLIPSRDVLPEGGEVTLSMIFTHPFEGGPIMPMERPARFGMVRGGETIDLSDRLEETPYDDVPAWSAEVDLAEPGPALFFVEPRPYWEPAEGKYIIHYAKVLVDSFATGEGWDTPIGLPVEIVPLTRPTGLWTGNVFQGVATKGGAPVPFAEVEVEFVNDGSVTAPNDAFVTQVIKADAAGVFTYAMPRAGWWGFAALLEGDAPMTAPDGAEVPVEEGALIWVRTVDMAGG